MNDALIRLREVSFSHEPGRPVLQGLNLEFGRGERVGLIGSNGSGKTTLLHLIVGLLRPAAGSIEAFGELRQKEADFREVRARVGLLFQDPEDQLFCPTVAEDVAFGPLNLGKSYSEALAIVTEALELLGLAGYEERITYKLSHGEKRLVSLATVLAMTPEVLLLDEPIAGLDEETRERVAETLTDLPMPMIVVSQDREFLRSITNKAVLLRNGGLESCHLNKRVHGSSRERP